MFFHVKKIIIGLTISSSLLALSGCATIFGSNTRSVRIDSQPQGAAIYVDDQQCGVTPAVVTLPNYIYGGKTIVLKKDGYKTQSNQIITRFQPITLVNILIWPGFLIDAATGSFVKIDENSLVFNTTLQKTVVPTTNTTEN
jgi:PEGA domain-containing protein